MPTAEKRGFTITELLVAIAIIGILFSFIIASLSGAKSRPGRRPMHVAPARVLPEPGNWRRRNGWPLGSAAGLASAGSPFYTAGDGMRSYFESRKIDSQFAYSPANPLWTAQANGDGWLTEGVNQIELDWDRVVIIDDGDEIIAAGVPIAVIVNDSGSNWSSTGTWSAGSSTSYYSGDYHINNSGSATTCTWTMQLIPLSGEEGTRYRSRVELWGRPHSNRNPSATITVTDARTGSPHTFNVDLRTKGASTGDGWWTLDDQFEFVAQSGVTYTLTLDTNASSAYTIADAVRVTPVEKVGGAAEPEQGFRVLSGTWLSWDEGSDTEKFWESTSRGAEAGTGSVAQWLLTFGESSDLHVLAWWRSGANRSTSVTYNLKSDAGSIGAYTVNQRDSGNEWVRLTSTPVSFLSATQYIVEMQTDGAGSGFLMADAVAVAPTKVVHEDAELIGYLYLAYRADLPGKRHGDWVMPMGLRDLDNPAGTPLLADWLVKTPGATHLSSHGGKHCHVLTMDGGVRTIQADQAVNGWTNVLFGADFYW